MLLQAFLCVVFRSWRRDAAYQWKACPLQSRSASGFIEDSSVLDMKQLMMRTCARENCFFTLSSAQGLSGCSGGFTHGLAV